MRKADYAALAVIIKRRLDEIADSETTSQAQDHTEHGEYSALHNLAHEFAKVASVDEVLFLKACGLA